MDGSGAVKSHDTAVIGHHLVLECITGQQNGQRGGIEIALCQNAIHHTLDEVVVNQADDGSVTQSLRLSGAGGDFYGYGREQNGLTKMNVVKRALRCDYGVK